MIQIFVLAVRWPCDNDMYDLNKICHINPDLVCAIKPAMMTDDNEDILTTDGMVYRVHSDESNLGLLKNWGSVLRDFQVSSSARD